MKPVSVVMPVFNAESFLRESIESILDQTYENFEFIIINDGSTDNSLNIINDYKLQDSRIRVITRSNRGLIYSLNEGINHSKGYYIARMDADDISHKKRLEEQINFMSDYKQIDVLGTKVETIGEFDESIKKEVQDRYGKDIDQKELSYAFLKENVICHPSVLMKKSFLESMGLYSIKYHCAEDYDLWMRGIKRGRTIDNLEQVLLKYRIHSSSKVRRDNINYCVVRDIMNIKFDFLKDFYEKKNFSYLIWGASNAGQIAQNIINARFSHYNFVGFVDKYKEGNFLGKDIYKPSQISGLNYDYIFIATSNGKQEVENHLTSMGLQPIQSFLWLI